MGSNRKSTRKRLRRGHNRVRGEEACHLQAGRLEKPGEFLLGALSAARAHDGQSPGLVQQVGVARRAGDERHAGLRSQRRNLDAGVFPGDDQEDTVGDSDPLTDRVRTCASS